MGKFYAAVIRALASQTFFYVVLAIAALQAVWYAASFAPHIFDEPRHLGVIAIYSHQLSPFLSHQPAAWDHLGELTRDGSYLFYYLMSWPLRLLRLITDSTMAQVIGLRLICTAFFAGGIVLYRKALLLAGAPKVVMNVVLLFFVITPAVALLPGAVNYDNLVFLLFALVLYLAVRVLKVRTIKILPIVSLLITGLVMCEVKWSSAALLLPVMAYLAYELGSRHGTKVFALMRASARNASRPWLIAAIVGLVLSLGLFIERPVVNVIEYGKPAPGCAQILNPERCMHASTYRAYATVDASKPANFHPKNPVVYFMKFWSLKMIDTQVNQLELTYSQLPLAEMLFTAFAFIGVILMLMYLRAFWRNRTYRFLLIVAVVYIFILFAQEYVSYVHHGVPAAIRSRYLLPISPIFMYFVALAFVNFFGKYKKTLLMLGCLTLLAFTQGGGIITFSLTTPETYYWKNSVVRNVNDELRHMIRPFVKD